MAEPTSPEKAPAQKLRKRGFITLLRDIAGTATVETVIMIPVMVAIWGGIWYTHQRYRHAVNMAQFNRAHTWAHAFSACDGSSSSSTSFGSGTYSTEGTIPDSVPLPVGRDSHPTFGFEEIEGRRQTSVERPAVLGEGTVSMEHNLVMLCNEQIQGERGLARAAWDMFF